ncbi:uncharacterized protein si:ch1073-303d10.1 isoform X1 [Xyrichtys novacula]|uniref:Uncharacterized protein si:ch1073-303d10.1 isoform X1 n=1 Tax=Xyrichtys novacula TaxID=13765 RepID=A0AAV1FSI7_XYRNO|nr:uncharacterized protein si:ch1073-303d10.1 isoform X1 [Xyrichtys novacula]
MSCIPASLSMSTLLSQGESEVDGIPVERRGSRAYQIFPEANMSEDSDSSSYPEDFLYRRERLPSIVVEPTEQSEENWTARCAQSNNAEDEEEEESSTGGAIDAELLEDSGIEECSISRKSSIGPSQSQLSLSRLTPPTSPTPPEAAPPCLRS